MKFSFAPFLQLPIRYPQLQKEREARQAAETAAGADHERSATGGLRGRAAARFANFASGLGAKGQAQQQRPQSLHVIGNPSSEGPSLHTRAQSIDTRDFALHDNTLYDVSLHDSPLSPLPTSTAAPREFGKGQERISNGRSRAALPPKPPLAPRARPPARSTPAEPASSPEPDSGQETKVSRGLAGFRALFCN